MTLSISAPLPFLCCGRRGPRRCRVRTRATQWLQCAAVRRCHCALKIQKLFCRLNCNGSPRQANLNNPPAHHGTKYKVHGGTGLHGSRGPPNPTSLPWSVSCFRACRQLQTRSQPGGMLLQKGGAATPGQRNRKAMVISQDRTSRPSSSVCKSRVASFLSQMASYIPQQPGRSF